MSRMILSAWIFWGVTAVLTLIRMAFHYRRRRLLLDWLPDFYGFECCRLLRDRETRERQELDAQNKLIPQKGTTRFRFLRFLKKKP